MALFPRECLMKRASQNKDHQKTGYTFTWCEVATSPIRLEKLCPPLAGHSSWSGAVRGLGTEQLRGSEPGLPGPIVHQDVNWC